MDGAGGGGSGGGRGAGGRSGSGGEDGRRAGVALDDHVVELGLEPAEAGAVGALERDELVAEVEHRAGVGRRVGRDVGVDLLERARLAHRGVERAGDEAARAAVFVRARVFGLAREVAKLVAAARPLADGHLALGALAGQVADQVFDLEPIGVAAASARAVDDALAHRIVGDRVEQREGAVVALRVVVAERRGVVLVAPGAAVVAVHGTLAKRPVEVAAHAVAADGVAGLVVATLGGLVFAHVDKRRDGWHVAHGTALGLRAAGGGGRRRLSQVGAEGEELLGCEARRDVGPDALRRVGDQVGVGHSRQGHHGWCLRGTGARLVNANFKFASKSERSRGGIKSGATQTLWGVAARESGGARGSRAHG